jgi:excisionase family DNA binding protein
MPATKTVEVHDGTVTIAAAMAHTSLSRSYLYALMCNGGLKFVKIGRRRLIPRSELTRLLAAGLVGAGEHE